MQQDISHFDVSKVTKATEIFKDARNFNQTWCSASWEGKIAQTDLEYSKASIKCCVSGKHYKLNPNQTKYSNEEGANAVECLPCQPGRYTNDPYEYSLSCKVCPRGWYQDQTQKQFCLPCAPGKINALEDQALCQDCEPGKMNSNAKAEICVDCQPGTYQDQQGSSQCKTCKPGKRSNATGLDAESKCIQCKTGRFSSFSGSLYCTSCAKGQFNPKHGSATCEDCKTTTFQDQELKPSIECKPCPTGWNQQHTGKSFCTDLGYLKPSSCNDNQYLNNTSINPNDYSCVPCPKGGACEGPITQSGVRVMFGWSKCSNKSLKFEPCAFSASCLGVANRLFEHKFVDEKGNDPAMTNHNESCSTPYRNHSLLCASCAPNFSKSGLDAKCQHCPDPTANNAIAVLGVLAATVGVVAFVYVTLADQGEIKPEDGAQSIGLSFIQIISLLVTFPIAWPQIFVTLFQIGGAVTVLGQHLVNLKCMYPLQSEADVFFSTRIAWSILPLSLALVCCVVWFFLSKFQTMPTWKSNARASVVALLFLIWPGLCSETFAIFACRNVCGQNVMIIDLNEPCWEGRHAKYAVLAFGMLVCYVVGFPLLALMNVKRLHNRAVETQRTLQDLEGYLTWGQFMSAYHPKVWWWEITVALRKVVIAAIGVFGTEMGEMQIHLTLVLMVIVMLMTAVVRPFGNQWLLQCLELGTLAATFAALWAGSVFNTNPRCEDGNGGTLGWCDALSVLIALLIVLSVMASVAVVVYYKKQKECQACWDKHCQAKMKKMEHNLENLVHARRLRTAMKSLGKGGRGTKKARKQGKKKSKKKRPSANGPQRTIQIHTDPKTKRRYSHNSKSGVAAWLVEDSKEKEGGKAGDRAVEIGAGIEMMGNPMKREGGQRSKKEVVIDVAGTKKKKRRKSFKAHKDEVSGRIYYQNVDEPELTTWVLPEDGDLVHDRNAPAVFI